ncbi:MAG: DUF1295 domain-containing protein [Pseudomonadales bacterium]|nr:DUF1295 domain-containing protein [Pseudomonadales bacterium]
MTNADSTKGIVAALVTAGLITLAVSQDGIESGGWPIFAICALFAFVVQWLVFIPAYIFQTEHYFDLTGTLTYIGVVALALLLQPAVDFRGWIIALLVTIWAARLGLFLFLRVKNTGADSRFTEMKTVPTWFFMTWTVQGLWVVVTLSAGLAAITTTHSAGFGSWGYAGLVIWLVGFSIEAIADWQKSVFRQQKQQAGGPAFISSGLWSWSRHPNYFGEITLWLGIAIIALPTLEGWRWVALISPVFVTLLLTRISGVHMLEQSAQARWGDDEEYQAYVKRTSVLVPMPPS